MRVAVATNSFERFVDTVNCRYPGAVIKQHDRTATLGTTTLVMVATPEQVHGQEFDLAWLNESDSVELSELIRTHVRPSRA